MQLPPAIYRILNKKAPSEKEMRSVITTLLPKMPDKCLRNMATCQFGEGFPNQTEVIYQMLLLELRVQATGWDGVMQGLMAKQAGMFQWINLKKYGIPLRRVSLDTMNLIKTCPGPTWVSLWEETTTPKFQSIHYVLPKNNLTVENYEIVGITVSILSGEDLREEMIRQQHLLAPEKPPMKLPEMGNQMMVTAYASNNSTWSVGRIFKTNEITPIKFEAPSEKEHSTEELGFLEALVSYGLQLLLLENTRPEFDLLEKVETHHSGSGRTSLTRYPRIIGGDMHRFTRVINKEGNSDDGRKRPKEHWRGSHWKQVAYGPKMTLRKAKLIMPCLVNPNIE